MDIIKLYGERNTITNYLSWRKELSDHQIKLNQYLNKDLLAHFDIV